MAGKQKLGRSLDLEEKIISKRADQLRKEEKQMISIHQILRVNPLRSQIQFLQIPELKDDLKKENLDKINVEKEENLIEAADFLVSIINYVLNLNLNNANFNTTFYEKSFVQVANEANTRIPKIFSKIKGRKIRYLKCISQWVLNSYDKKTFLFKDLNVKKKKTK